ncbi:hypothetical protein BP00DRAFT_111812 [Aspergillus indologenus CBS 114.80]|uniref:Secreted protein n=1 Tax=Aspergillus indologenus CBS 114.80 TaxID=1450541 RepID=A0A2V5J6Z0_9EURO|nr:hypothetical protein BP00DRAFT_111812 [Aspergillus indologenus CBS 114.80]
MTSSDAVMPWLLSHLLLLVWIRQLVLTIVSESKSTWIRLLRISSRVGTIRNHSVCVCQVGKMSCYLAVSRLPTVLACWS